MVNNNFLVAVFKNRSYTYAFYNAMAKKGLKCFIINTPKQNYVSCGISCKFMAKDLTIATELTKPYKNSFVGFFKT